MCFFLRSLLGLKGLDWPAPVVHQNVDGLSYGGCRVQVAFPNQASHLLCHEPNACAVPVDRVSAGPPAGSPSALSLTVEAVLRKHQQRVVLRRKLPHQAWKGSACFGSSLNCASVVLWKALQFAQASPPHHTGTAISPAHPCC